MRNATVSPSLASALSRTAQSLQAARREALAAVAVEETEWEYAGRTWSWPAGEEMTYFRGLAPGEAAVLEAAETAHGLRALAVGTGRVAVALPADGVTSPEDHDGLVAKLARYGPSAEMGDGRTQNRRERRTWDQIGSHPFLPVLDADGSGGDDRDDSDVAVGDDSDAASRDVVDAEDGGDWVVMPRATVPPPEPARETALDRVRESLAAHAGTFHFDELKPENVGVYDDRFWIVDYGRPPGEPLFVDPPGGTDRPSF